MVDRARAGSKEAYSDLVRLHHPMVLSLCISLLRDDVKAQDAAQDAFLKAYNGLGGFRGDAKFSTWIYRIAYRQCLDVMRAERREKSESWDALIEKAGDRVERIIKSDSFEDASEKRDLVNRALQTLKTSHRDVLLLREEQGLTYEEIAEISACSIDSVKGRLKRARKELALKLRHFLGKAGVEAPARNR